MTPEQCRAVFLDLNGTLVLPLLVNRPHEYQLIAQSAEAVGLLCQAGLACPVITVQSRIEKGLYSETEFQEWFDSLRATLAGHGAIITGPYVCPHRYRTPCECKKPTGAHRFDGSSKDVLPSGTVRARPRLEWPRPLDAWMKW